MSTMFPSYVKDLGQAEERRCTDPECGGTAEPDQDGEHRYWICNECGFEFGWYRMPSQTLSIDADGGSCAIGVPQEVRAAASAPMEHALEDKFKASGKVAIDIMKRPGL